MKNSYPKITFHYELSYLSKLEPAFIKKPELPVEPQKKIFQKPADIPEETDGCIANGFIALLIGGLGMLLFQMGIEFGAFLIMPSGLVIMYYIFAGESIKKRRIKKRDEAVVAMNQYKENTRKAEEEYKNQLAVYREKKLSFEKDCQEVELKNNKIKSASYLLAFRIEKFKNYFSKIKKPKSLNQKVQKGVSHDFFMAHLMKNFGLKIFDKYYIKNKNFENLIYVPDFVYYDVENNILIDIEIDEPYIGSDGEPIHFTNSNDSERDDFMSKKKWIVIRFAEFQIINYPQECCDLIRDITLELSNCNLLNFSHQTKVPKIEQWSKEEAHKFAFHRYRNSYLPNQFIEKLSSEYLENDRQNLNPIPIYYDDLPF